MTAAAPYPVPSTPHPVPSASQPRHLTADEFYVHGNNRPSELVRGVVVPGQFAGFQHGEVCNRLARWVGGFVRDNRLGHALFTGVITQRNPDTVRGPALSYFSYLRVPKGEEPEGYTNAIPELVFEVVSPTNTRGEITTKIGEYLNANVSVVCVVDPEYQIVNLRFPDHPTEKLAGDQSLTFTCLPGFSLPVRKLFE